MKKFIVLPVLIILAFVGFSQRRNPKNKAIYLEDISWTKAKEILTPEAVVVIPVGAGAKEHGPHLPLSADFIQAEGCAKLLALERKVFIAPTINYGYYPAFLNYTGSTSLSFSTSIDVVLQVIRSMAGYGIRRFYVINIGVSTTPTLERAAKILAEEGLLLYFSRYDRPNFEKAEQPLRSRPYGGHADEIETSNLLYLRPDLVDMSKAVDDSSDKNNPGLMAPFPIEGGVVNISGITGYATLGTKDKGRLYMNAYTKEVIKEIDSISTCNLPIAKDRTAEYKIYEGAYTDSRGNTVIVSQKDKLLDVSVKGQNFKFDLKLNKDADDYFSSIDTKVLFIRNEHGEVTKAWCQFGAMPHIWWTRTK
jgi:creatinine amidohydrolase